MKKSIIIIFIVSALALIGGGVWIYTNKEPINFSESIHFVVIFILVVFATFLGINRLRSTKQGLPAEDELSKKLLEKASSKAFYISLYFWLVLMYFGSEKNDDSEELFGFGILGMAIIFALSWLYYRFIGLKKD